MGNPLHNHLNQEGFGLLTVTDVNTIKYSLDYLVDQFADFSCLNLLEIGTFNGSTARKIKEYLDAKNINFHYIGIDSNRDNQCLALPFKNAEIIIGESSEIHSLVNCKIHWLLIDGCHCVNHVMLDFLNYFDKVEKNGLILFHDVAPQGQGVTYQGHGPQNSDFCIGISEAHRKLNISNDNRLKHIITNYEPDVPWGGGISVYQKIN